jgi:DNA-binding NarL/FixJ family response regulator
MMPGERIRVFVVDDHQVVRMGIKTMLESEPDIVVVGTADSAQEALEKLPGAQVDVVLTDLRMAEMNGEELMVQLRKRFPELRCAVLTNYHSDEDVFNAMKAGAMAYILKTATLEQVVGAIRTVHAGGHAIPPRIAHQLAQRVSRIELSTREMEIVQLVARGMKNREIAAKLFISEFTVRNHVINLLEKIGNSRSHGGYRRSNSPGAGSPGAGLVRTKGFVPLDILECAPYGTVRHTRVP